VTGPYDVDALAAYFGRTQLIAPPPLNRIGRID
jgi:hypothetical protein